MPQEYDVFRNSLPYPFLVLKQGTLYNVSMAYTNEDEEIECEIIKSYGVFSGGKGFWNKQVNLISWNGRPPKLDIRSWQRDQKKCGKGIALTREEAAELVKLLNKILKEKPGQEKPQKAAKKAKATVPAILEPFYDELELVFGAGPDECKSARNTLLKKYHPDKNASNIAFATRKTIKIKDAYDKLMEWWNGH